MKDPHTPPGLPRSVGVIGGGTAGYFAALAIKRRFPSIEVTIVESSEVPIIGVGEATTTLMPPFLHGQLGLDAVELYRAVKPTFKLGIRFEWGMPADGHFNYPFGDTDPIAAMAFDRDLHAQSLMSQVMDADRVPIVRSETGEITSLLPRMKFAYHLNNAPFVAYLAAAAKSAGIAHIDMKIERASTRAEGADIEALHGPDGRELRFDLYVDASGFRSLLLEQSLGSPFESYASTLFCDRAIVATVPQRGLIRPYTTAETMDSGWCWRIPVSGEDHRGYVHASAFLSEDAAVAEMRRKNPEMSDPKVVKFRSGRHRDFWTGNTVAVGNAYGFVEPLESTALHMVIVEIGYLLGGIEAMGDPKHDGSFRGVASAAIGGHWDYLRWFLGVHYKLNQRLETPFWQAARRDVSITGLEPAIDRFRTSGPWTRADGPAHHQGDAVFGYNGLMLMLLGQQLDAPMAPPAGVTRDAWQARKADQKALVDGMLSQADALEALHADPALIQAFSAAPSSWCQGEAEQVSVTRTGEPRVHPKTGGHTQHKDALETLLQVVR